jgi:hypothetical protein
MKYNWVLTTYQTLVRFPFLFFAPLFPFTRRSFFPYLSLPSGARELTSP